MDNKQIIGHMIVGNGEHGRYSITEDCSTEYIFVPIAAGNLDYYRHRGYKTLPVYADQQQVEWINTDNLIQFDIEGIG